MFSEWKPGPGFLNKEEDTVKAAAGRRDVMERESAGERPLVTGLSRDLDKPGDSRSLPIGFEGQVPSWLQPCPGGRPSGALLLPKYPPAMAGAEMPLLR